MIISHSHYANGIDVSDNNGDFNWHSWEGHISFAMIKATEGPIPEYPNGLVDTQFIRNWEGAKAIGIHRFAYHYFHPEHDPATQAAHFIRTVRAAGLDLSDNFMFDFEEAPEGMSIHEIAFAAWVFLREVNRLAPEHHIVCYTYPYFAETGYCAMLKHWGLHIANWNVPSPHVPPPWSSPGPMHGWQFWQFAAGSKGSPDLNRFNGTEHDLEVYCTR